MLPIIKKFIPAWLIRLYHFKLAFLSALVYRFPSQKLIVIGVTGTKGKSTTVALIHQVLAGSGVKVASLSSVAFKIGDEEIPNILKMTMPGRFFVQRFLRRAVGAGCKYVVIEVTSQGIVQYRHRFITFDTAVMTNIAREHIEAHGGFEPYLRAKLDLFWRLSSGATAVINEDDAQAQRFKSATSAKVVPYGKEGIRFTNEDLRITNIHILQDGIKFQLAGEDIQSSLLGGFNLYNILAACAVGMVYHIPMEQIAQGIHGVIEVPGRMEFVAREPFCVVVDYAHTPDSLRNVYSFLRESGISNFQETISKQERKKLICVLGATGGGRDKWKRPEFGKIAAEFCDKVILTNEDPYDENPATIIDEIQAGFSQIPNSKFQILNSEKVLDRREAIRKALKQAKAHDVVVITGKGAEQWIMGPNGTKEPWDDRKVVAEELKKRV